MQDKRKTKEKIDKFHIEQSHWPIIKFGKVSPLKESEITSQKDKISSLRMFGKNQNNSHSFIICSSATEHYIGHLLNYSNGIKIKDNYYLKDNRNDIIFQRGNLRVTQVPVLYMTAATSKTKDTTISIT